MGFFPLPLKKKNWPPQMFPRKVPLFTSQKGASTKCTRFPPHPPIPHKKILTTTKDYSPVTLRSKILPGNVYFPKGASPKFPPGRTHCWAYQLGLWLPSHGPLGGVKMVTIQLWGRSEPMTYQSTVQHANHLTHRNPLIFDQLLQYTHVSHLIASPWHGLLLKVSCMSSTCP